MDKRGSEGPTCFRVGDLLVDIGLQRVTRDAVELPMPRLSFELLLALVRAAPDFVSNRQLLALVWPGVVVTDKTVAQRIKLLRDALGDSADEPRYIGSLRSRGYRILAPVAPATRENDRSAFERRPPESIAATRRAWALRSWPIVALTALVLTAAISLWGTVTREPPRAAETVPAGSSTPRLVVLPFRREDQVGVSGFVGNGIAEAVRDRLASLEGLDTIAPESTMRSLDSEPDGSEVARQLDAGFVLDGTVERAADALRVSVQLRDTHSGSALWNGSFDRPLSEIFAVQEEIADEVAAALRQNGIVATPQVTASRRPPTENVDAYLAYLRGRAMLGQWTIAAAEKAQAEFSAAIERDPEFSAAYASLYEARLLAADRAAGGASPNVAAAYLGEKPLATARARNQSLIDRAIELDPRSGAAYFARAIWADGDSAEREADFVRGLELDPGNGRGIIAYSEFLDRAERTAEAGRMLDRALAIDPIAPRAHFRRAMRAFPIVPAELMAGMARALEIDPDYQPALQRYAKYRWMFDGDLAFAIRTIEHAMELDPGNPWLTHTAVAMYLDIGDPDTARALLAGADRPDIAGDLLVALYDGRTRAAGEAAMKDTAFANGFYENWGVYEAIRDYSLESADPGAALESLLARTGLVTVSYTPDMKNFRAVPAVAQLLEKTGRSDEARRLLTATIQWIDDYHLPNLSTIYALRVKASALLLLGEQELALAALDASFRSNDYMQWWYTLEQDPLWRFARDDGRLDEISARVQRHIEAQQAALATFREQGFVPVRVGP